MSGVIHSELNSATTMPRIVIVGHVCIDHNVSEHTTYTSWGSPALYIAKHLADTEAIKATILTNYGADILQYAKGFAFIPDKPTSPRSMVYRNTTTASGRTQHCFQPDATLPSLDKRARTALSNADLVIIAPIAPEYSPMYIQELLACTRDDAIIACCPQGYFRDIAADNSVGVRAFVEADEIVPFCNLLVMSEEDHPDINRLAPLWALNFPTSAVVVTRGPQGATLYQGKHITNIPTKPVPSEQIIDSVGCGDIFLIATALGLLRRNTIVQSIKGGHEAARRKLLTGKS